MPITAAKLMVEVGADYRQAEAGLHSVGGLVGNLGGVAQTAFGVFTGQLMMGAVNGMRNLAMEGVNAYGSYERLGLSLQSLVARELMNTTGISSMGEAMQQAGPRAEELLSWIQQLAIKSPFTQEGVASAYRMAMAYGFTSTEAQRLTTALINFAAGSGQSEGAMQMIALALGQIQAKGKLAGQEVLQLTNAGLAVDQILAKAFGKSTAEIVTMREQGLIPANAAIEAITESLERDFGGAAARQTGTVEGLISSLEDLKQVGLREFFTGLVQAVQPELQKLVDTLNTPQMMANIREMGDQFAQSAMQIVEGAKRAWEWISQMDQGTKNAILTIGGLVLVGPSVLGFVGSLASGIGGLIGVLGGLPPILSAVQAGWGAWQAGMTLTTALGAAGIAPIAITLGAIALAVGAVVGVWLMWNQAIAKTNEEGKKAVGGTWAKFFNDQVAAGKSATQITQEYIQAQERVRSVMEGTNPVLRLFISNQAELTGSFEAFSQAMSGTSGSYAEYASKLREVATASGLVVDREGNLVRAIQTARGGMTGLVGTSNQVVQAHYMMSQAEWDQAQKVGLLRGEQEQLNETLGVAGVNAREMALAFGTDAVNGLAALQSQGLATKDILGMVDQALQGANWTAGAATEAHRQLTAALGGTVSAQERLTADVQLLANAFSLGVIGAAEFTTYMQQAQSGTLMLSDAQRQAIQAAADHAQSLREEAQAAQDAARRQLELAESLKGASAAEIAKAAIGELNKALESGKLPFSDYVTAVQKVQEAFGLTTPQSEGLAKGLVGIVDALQKGALPASNFAIALKKVIDASKGGDVDIGKIVEAAGGVPEALGSAVSDMESYAGGFSTTMTKMVTDSGVMKTGVGTNMQELRNTTLPAKEMVEQLGQAIVNLPSSKAITISVNAGSSKKTLDELAGSAQDAADGFNSAADAVGAFQTAINNLESTKFTVTITKTTSGGGGGSSGGSGGAMPVTTTPYPGLPIGSEPPPGRSNVSSGPTINIYPTITSEIDVYWMAQQVVDEIRRM